MILEEKKGGSLLGTYRVERANMVSGKLRPPGDKSISHRAVIFGGIAKGRTEISGFLNSADCEGTLQAFLSMGVKVDRIGPHHLIIESPGQRNLGEPSNVLDFGNSGTAVRLMTGLLAGIPGFRVLTGDESLRSRPMKRVTEPLLAMGASIDGREGGSRLPLAVRGRTLRSIVYENIHRSAQVKSAILLAGLSAELPTTVIETIPSRDHTERLLPRFGGRIESNEGKITIWPSDLSGIAMDVPGDLSSAAFFIALALLVPESKLTIQNVGLNPTRTAFLKILSMMGAKLSITLNPSGLDGEPFGEIEIESSSLNGCTVPLEMIPAMIDEIPILATLASFAHGRTEIRGASELRVKESDRIKSMVTALRTVGVEVEEFPDGLAIEGGGLDRVLKGGLIDSHHDHRVSMSMAILGSRLPPGESLVITGTDFVETSFPGFASILNTVGQA